MGSMSFLLPNPLPAAAAATLPDACVASTVGYYDQTPVPTTVRITTDRLILTRTQNESGYLVVPWPVEPFGTLVLTSTTLRERDGAVPAVGRTRPREAQPGARRRPPSGSAIGLPHRAGLRPRAGGRDPHLRPLRAGRDPGRGRHAGDARARTGARPRGPAVAGLRRADARHAARRATARSTPDSRPGIRGRRGAPRPTSTPTRSTPPTCASAGATWSRTRRSTTGRKRTRPSPPRRPPGCPSPSAR